MRPAPTPRTTPARRRALERLEAGERRALRAYNRPLYPGHPALRMLAANVREARRAGAKVVVVVSGVPIGVLQKHDAYDVDAWERRIALVGRIVENAGGQFLDLHDAVPQRAFRDAGGHFNEEGHRIMAARVAPTVRTLANRRPPAP